MKKILMSVAITTGLALVVGLNSWAQKNAPLLKLGDPLPANTFVELAKLINPTVVNISTSTMPKFRNRNRDPLSEMLEQFYGLQQMPQNIRPMQALGTGFIIREDGLIVTNNHVIAGADVINVQLSENKDEKLYEAKVIGSDERTDIALIKIQPKEKLPVAQLGSSKETEVGEWVAAFGNPYGQGHTVTKGIISAKGRAIGEINKFPLMQTDTPINPGNSGGPLVNTRGYVIGVNSAIDARAQGIGFAIPIDEVKSIIPQLEKIGRIRKGYLGVGLGDLNPQAAEQLGMKDAQGAVIVQVEKGAAAAKGGIRLYDIVTEFNGRKIKTASDLTDAVSDATIGSKVPVKVVREGQTKTLEITVAERPVAPQKSRDFKRLESHKAPFDLGFSVANMSDQVRREFGIPDEFDKPVITEVMPSSRAAAEGLRPGDVILDVNRVEVAKAQDVLRQIKKGTNTLRIARGDAVAILAIRTP